MASPKHGKNHSICRGGLQVPLPINLELEGFMRPASQRSTTIKDDLIHILGNAVVKHTTFRTLLAVAVALGLKLHQMDIKTAFLNGEEAIWMQRPQGCTLGPEGAACRLKKSIHGLKKAPRSWHAKLKSVFQKEVLHPSVADPALFVKQTSSDMV
jgi:hypothetical protein